MTKEENERLDGFGIELHNLSQATERNTLAIKDIGGNHLPTIMKKLTHQDDRLGLLLKIFGIGFTVIGIMVTILTIVVAVR